MEHSTDLLHWNFIADPLFGNDETVSQLVSSSGVSGFYRLKVETFPEAGDARWSLTGSRMVINAADGVRRMTFDDNATGTMTRESAVTSFTWQWQRDGLDTGIATITWPDATSERMKMQFTGNNAGVFSSERTANGLPAGAVSGTFRDAAEPDLAVSVPATLGNALLTFDGTGRAVGIKVNADGTAGITTPAGKTVYGCSYAVTGPATAELNMVSDNGATESWTLTFAGPACGTYAWKTMLRGVPRRSSAGSFNIAPR